MAKAKEKGERLHACCRVELLLDSKSKALVEAGRNIVLLLRKIDAHITNKRVDMDEVKKWARIGRDQKCRYFDTEKIERVMLQFVNEGCEISEGDVDTLMLHFDPKEKGKFQISEFDLALERSRKSLRSKPKQEPQEDQEMCLSVLDEEEQRHNYTTSFGKQALSNTASCSNTRFMRSARFPVEFKADKHKQELGPGVYDLVDKSKMSVSRSSSAFSVGKSNRPSPANVTASTTASLTFPSNNAIGTNHGPSKLATMGSRVLFRDTFALQEKFNLANQEVGPASYQRPLIVEDEDETWQYAGDRRGSRMQWNPCGDGAFVHSRDSGGKSLKTLTDLIDKTGGESRQGKGTSIARSALSGSSRTGKYAGWDKIDSGVSKRAPACSFGTDEKPVNKRTNFFKGAVEKTVMVPVSYDTLAMMGEPGARNSEAHCSRQVSAPAFSMSARVKFYHPETGVNNTSPYYVDGGDDKGKSKSRGGAEVEAKLQRRQQKHLQAHMKRFQPHIS
jgi:hypothetical protein